MRITLLSGLILACGAFAQTDPAPAFEAASIKPNNSTSGGSHSRTRARPDLAYTIEVRGVILARNVGAKLAVGKRQVFAAEKRS